MGEDTAQNLGATVFSLMAHGHLLYPVFTYLKNKIWFFLNLKDPLFPVNAEIGVI